MYKSARAAPAGVSAMAWPIDSDTFIDVRFPPQFPTRLEASVRPPNCQYYCSIAQKC